MQKSKVLTVFVLICYFLFAFFEFSGNDLLSYFSNCLMVPLITLMYFFSVKKKNTWFLMFLLCYALADIIGLCIIKITAYNSELWSDFNYYIGNTLYILSYVFLIINIGHSLSFKYVFEHFRMHLLVLIGLIIYLVYFLHEVINPNLILESDYYLELVYNLVVFSLLAISLLNYFYKDNKKSLYLFLGALCIVFSEVIDTAYIYVDQRSILIFLSATLTLVGFYFFYQQAKLLNISPREKRY